VKLSLASNPFRSLRHLFCVRPQLSVSKTAEVGGAEVLLRPDKEAEGGRFVGRVSQRSGMDGARNIKH